MGRTARHPRQAADGGSPTGQKFEYDEENRLVTVRRASDNATLLTITYDALGRRAESTDYVCAGLPCGTGFQPVLTRHVFDGIQTTQEYTKCPSQSWALAREFVWGDRFPQPVALIAYGGSGGYGGSGLPSGTSVYHYLHDVLGSVVALTRSDGKVVERYTYDPYGRTVIEQTDPNTGLPVTRSDASVFGNPFAWTGQRYDGGVRLYHFLYRTYLPHLGRWGQRDPGGFKDSASLVEHTLGNPTTFVDRLGLCAVISHHVYPLGLGGDPDGRRIGLSPHQHDKFHNAQHDDGQGWRGPKGTADKNREKWKELTREQQKELIKKWLIAAGVDPKEAERIAEEAMNNADNRPGEKRYRPGEDPEEDQPFPEQTPAPSGGSVRPRTSESYSPALDPYINFYIVPNPATGVLLPVGGFIWLIESIIFGAPAASPSGVPAVLMV